MAAPHSANYLYTFKVVLLGPSGSGKSALLDRFVHDKFIKGFQPTIGAALKRRMLRVADETVELVMWDTAGQERFAHLSILYTRGCHVCVVCFDVTDRASLDDASSWFECFRKHGDPEGVVALVGTKVDLVDDRVVSQARAEDFAASVRADFYTETSSLTGAGVADLFQRSAEALVARHAGSPPHRSVATLMITEEEPRSRGCCGGGGSHVSAPRSPRPHAGAGAPPQAKRAARPPLRAKVKAAAKIPPPPPCPRCDVAAVVGSEAGVTTRQLSAQEVGALPEPVATPPPSASSPPHNCHAQHDSHDARVVALSCSARGGAVLARFQSSMAATRWLAASGLAGSVVHGVVTTTLDTICRDIALESRDTPGAGRHLVSWMRDQTLEPCLTTPYIVEAVVEEPPPVVEVPPPPPVQVTTTTNTCCCCWRTETRTLPPEAQPLLAEEQPRVVRAPAPSHVGLHLRHLPESVPPEALAALAGALEWNAGVDDLDLTGVFLGRRPAAAHAVLDQGLVTLRRLRVLHLVSNAISGDVTALLAGSLLHCTFLRTLDVSDNPLHSGGLVLVLDACPVGLTHLAARQCEAGDDAGGALAEFVARLDGLRQLEVADNRLGEAAALLLGPALSRCRTLTSVDVSGNRMPEEAVASLRRQLPSADCVLRGGISDACVHALDKHFKGTAGGFQITPALPLGGPEVATVADLFHESMPRDRFKLLVVRRLHHGNAQTAFMFQRRLLEARNPALAGGDTRFGPARCGAGERLLFHGTSTMDPAALYTRTDTVLDVNFASSGRYGSGLYFAERARYSHGYAFQPGGDGAVRVMLAVRVLTGRPRDYGVSAQRGLVEPVGSGFDSVKGGPYADWGLPFGNREDVSTVMYVVYNSARCLPAYELEYAELG